MKRRLKVTVMMDDACIVDEPPHFRTLNEGQATEYHVVNALRKLGHEVSILGVANEVGPLVEALTKDRPEIVFNLSEQFRDQRHLDRNVAGLLELLDIPFTGTGSIGLTLCRNKGLCKQLLSTRRIRVPGFAVFAQGKAARPPKSLRFPLVVKPLYEDGSDGISNSSLVRTQEELDERVRMMHERFNQPAIAEEFIDGKELYVGVVGNHRLTVLPPRELHFGKSGNGAPVLATYRAKWNPEYQKRWEIEFGFAEIDAKTMENIARVCRRTFRLLQINDYGRIDLRLSGNRAYVLEANPNPGLDTTDEVAKSAKRAGIEYCRLIDRVVRLALKRHEESRQ